MMHREHRPHRRWFGGPHAPQSINHLSRCSAQNSRVRRSSGDGLSAGPVISSGVPKPQGPSIFGRISAKPSELAEKSDFALRGAEGANPQTQGSAGPLVRGCSSSGARRANAARAFASFGPKGLPKVWRDFASPSSSGTRSVLTSHTRPRSRAPGMSCSRGCSPRKTNWARARRHAGACPPTPSSKPPRRPRDCLACHLFRFRHVDAPTVSPDLRRRPSRAKSRRRPTWRAARESRSRASPSRNFATTYPCT